MRSGSAMPGARIRRPVQVQRALDPAAVTRHELLHRVRPRPARHDDLHQAAGQHAHREPPRAAARAHAPGIVRRRPLVEQAELARMRPAWSQRQQPAARLPRWRAARRVRRRPWTRRSGAGETPRPSSARDELALRLLACTDDDRIDRQQPRLAALRNREAGVVDALVGDAGEHAHAAALEREAMHPARRLAEVAAGRRRPSLQQPDLRAARRASDAGTRPPRAASVMSMPHSRMKAGMSRLVAAWAAS